MKRICKQCGKEFELSKNEMQFYKKKHLSLPRRCKECREKNKGEEEKPSVPEPEINRTAPQKPADGNGGKKKPAAADGKKKTGGNTEKKPLTQTGNRREPGMVKNDGKNRNAAGNQNTRNNGTARKKTANAGKRTENRSGRNNRSKGTYGNRRYGNERKNGNRSGASAYKIRALLGLAAALLLLAAVVAAGWDRLSPGQDEIPNVRVETLGFRTEQLLEDHYEKHGVEMGFDSAEEYEAAAARVVEDSRALHKREEADGDDMYYLEETNELVIVSTDGYIRTYFEPDDGIEYYERQ